MQVDKYFRYEHLPEKLQQISQPFGELARWIAAQEWPDAEQQAAALQKLLEAKDCAVRASMP